MALQEGAIIDRRLQDTLWKDAAAEGDQLTNSFARGMLTVTGVAGAVREWNQGDHSTGTVYVDFHSRPDALGSMHFVVRMDPRTSGADQAVRRALAAVDPLVPVTVESLEVRTRESLSDRRLMLTLAGGFALIALVLAGAGVYAMVAFAARRQLREAAIRLALGASPASVRRRIIRQGLTPSVAGIAVGLGLAVPMGRAIRGQLFQVLPTDPAVLAATLAAVLLAAALASWLPARHAGGIDPARALRQD